MSSVVKDSRDVRSWKRVSPWRTRAECGAVRRGRTTFGRVDIVLRGNLVTGVYVEGMIGR